LYFLNDHTELESPLNHRNEAAAISLLLQRLRDPDEPRSNQTPSCPSSRQYGENLQRKLQAYSESLWPNFNAGDASLVTDSPATESSGATATVLPPPPPPYSPAASFHGWAEEQGIQSAIRIARFGALRGCAAAKDIRPGDNVLSIPQSALLYDETISQTDLGRMLYALPGVSADNVLIIFTMIDRHEPTSQWDCFWKSLPAAFQTGLSFPPHVLGALAGTAAALEIQRGQAHLKAQFENTRPLFEALLKAYPDYFQPEWFEYDSYVWAAELWYSYAFEIEFPPNEKSKTVMVPFACHVNHSPWPHVVR
jgi:hypothetical protein